MIKAEYRKITDLHELENNPRTISNAQFEKLKKSITDNKDYFEARPIIVSNRTGKLVIIAGNQRYKAAKAIGMVEVPTVLLEGLSEAREREIIIRDNVSNGDWDMDTLANEWDVEELQEWGVDNIKTLSSTTKEIKEVEPKITTSFISFEFADTIELPISEETAKKLLEEMLEYRDHDGNGSYKGFWDRRLS